MTHSANTEIAALQDELRKRGRPPPQRRVYVLPAQLVKRVLQYALDHDLASEVEAARELLEIGLAAKEQAA
jgi:hypothetical protein